MSSHQPQDPEHWAHEQLPALAAMEAHLRAGGKLDQAEADRLLDLTTTCASHELARQLSAVIAESHDERFIPLLVERVARDPDCALPQTLSFLHALGECLEESNDAFANPRGHFTPEFIRQLGHWLLGTGGGELSWKASFILHNIRTEEAFHFLRLGVLDGSLLPQTRANCLLGLVNGRAPGLEDVLRVLSSDADPAIQRSALSASAWLRDQG